jgi:hypothetical protein
MPDMFGRTTILGGAMSAEATRITFSGVTGLNTLDKQAGLIMQQLNIQYSQNITRLYALEDAKVYFIAGRTEGSFTIQHVIGPQGLLKSFIEAYGNVCGVLDKVFNISMATGCGTEPTGGNLKQNTIRLQCPLITSINLQMQAQNMIIGSGIQGMFVAMEIVDNSGNGLGVSRDMTALV